MKEFVTNFWSSQAFFERSIRTIVYLVGTLITAGVIPTGIDHGGPVLGGIISAIPFLIAAGQKNTEAVPTPQQLDRARAEQRVEAVK